MYDQVYEVEQEEKSESITLTDEFGFEKLSISGIGLLFMGIALFLGQQFLSVILAQIITIIINATNQVPHLYNINNFAGLLSEFLAVGVFIFLIRKDLKRLYLSIKSGNTWHNVGKYFMLIILLTMLYGIILNILNVESTSANQDSINFMIYLTPVMGGLMVCVAAPLFEEIVFRVGIFRGIYCKNKTLAFIITAGFFAFLHLLLSLSTGTFLQDLTSLPSYLIGGVVLTLSYYKTQNMAVPILVHAIYNTFQFMLLMLL